MRAYARLLLSLLAFAGLPASLAAAQNTTAQISELSEDALQDWIGKLNGHTKLLNGSLRAVSAWSRYKSWVNLKTGPTGKERIIYGLYSVSQGNADSALEAGRRAVQAEPRIAPLDEISERYAATFEQLVPLLIEAEAYYERKDYKDDKMAKGKELHAKLVSLFATFLEQREALEKEMKTVKTAVDEKQLAFIEAREGKSYAWHSRNVLMKAAEVADVLSDGGEDMGSRLDKVIPPFATAVREFDDYVASPNATKKGSFDSLPRSFLGNVREFRDEMSDRMTANMKLQFLIQEYNMMVNMSSIGQ